MLHLVRVEEGLSRLAQMGGQLNMEKCHIGETQVALLGHVVQPAYNLIHLKLVHC